MPLIALLNKHSIQLVSDLEEEQVLDWLVSVIIPSYQSSLFFLSLSSFFNIEHLHADIGFGRESCHTVKALLVG